MWGGVGRGKSFLMDSFFAVVPVQRKTRLHFHEFMREVHRELEDLKGQADPLDELARRIAKRYRLICFDEFHVSDIADAMILYRLLDRLFDNGVQFVMTSNYDPDTLYPDGLHRDRLLPAIELIKSKLDVINVDAGIDYRKRTLSQVDGVPHAARRRRRQGVARRFREARRGPRRKPAAAHREARVEGACARPTASSGSTSPRCAADRVRRTTIWNSRAASMR